MRDVTPVTVIADAVRIIGAGLEVLRQGLMTDIAESGVLIYARRLEDT